jgi:hypothetical protein
MATITFDTLKFTKTLEKAGVPPEQAEAMAEAFREASGEADLVTKKDLLIGLVAPIHADLTLVKWMLGILLGGVMALILKTFFPM